MKLLLDECLPLDPRHHLTGHEAHTVQWAGLKGTKNGELLSRAEAMGYEVLLTADQGIHFQQNLLGRKVSIVVLRSRTNQLENLIPLVPLVLKAITMLEPGVLIYLPD